MEKPVRPLVTQPFNTFVVPVGIAPTPLFAQQTQADMINAFVISVDAGAANNIFIGGTNVTIASGIEIVAGAGPVEFRIIDERMLYEVMAPLLNLLRPDCQESSVFPIPFVVWDLQSINAVAIAATNVRILPFQAQFV